MISGIDRLCKILWNEPLAPYTTFKVGGSAEALALPESPEILAGLVTNLAERNIPWLVLGRGSNVLVSDRGVPGVVILLGENLSTLEVLEEDDERVSLKVQSGCSLSRLLNWAMKRGLTGLEFSLGIPAGLGGAIVMNCGAWGENISDVLTAVTVMQKDGFLVHLPKDRLSFGYRSWGGDDSLIVVEAFLQLGRKEESAVREKCRQLQDMRRGKQPLGKASCGCFFRNPEGDKSAGQLIEEAGLKGFSVGAAQVSEVHANFIVNNGGAKASDILTLFNIIRRKVERDSSVILEPEVKFIGC